MTKVEFMPWLEKTVLSKIAVLGEQRHLRATRDGIVSILPLVIIGSLFLLLGSLNLDWFAQQWGDSIPWLKTAASWYSSHTALLLVPYRLSMGLMALFASFTVAYFLARSYDMEGLPSALASSAGFLITQTPALLESGKPALPLKDLGGAGLFTAIFLAFFAVEVGRFCKSKKLSFSFPESVPPSVVQAFANLLPVTVIITTIWVVVHLFGINIIGLVSKILSPLTFLGDTIWAVILVNLVMQIIWLAGVHGASVMVAIFLPFWMEYLEANSAAVASHMAAPHITTLPFYQWFVWIGGSGATLSLVLLMCFSKSGFLKKLGKLSLIPGICNINEPVIFGLPIVMNPVLAIPFILAPVLSGVIAYMVLALGWVGPLYSMPPWILPGPVGAFLACGLSGKAVLLTLFNFFLSGLIYYPFFKAYEQKMIEQESQPQNEIKED
ncbi:MAG: PTS transporter subunit EIIC [Chloroflexi bacterium]|nr:PTS transporter subunit EIIC [Chloroflexota bacterium]